MRTFELCQFACHNFQKCALSRLLLVDTFSLGNLGHFLFLPCPSLLLESQRVAK